jgi:hypothetical protein
MGRGQTQARFCECTNFVKLGFVTDVTDVTVDLNFYI